MVYNSQLLLVYQLSVKIFTNIFFENICTPLKTSVVQEIVEDVGLKPYITFAECNNITLKKHQLIGYDCVVVS